MQMNKEYLKESEIPTSNLNKLFPNKGSIPLNDFISSDNKKNKRKIKSQWRGDVEYTINTSNNNNNKNKKLKILKYDSKKLGEFDDNSSDEFFSSEYSSEGVKESSDDSSSFGLLNDQQQQQDTTTTSSMRKRANKLRGLGIGGNINKKEFEEALLLTKEFEKLRRVLMSDANVEFFLFVHELVNIPIKIFEPLASTLNDIQQLPQTHKNSMIKEKINELKDLKSDIDKERRRQSVNIVKRSFEFINQPLITNRLNIDPKVLSSLLEVLTNLRMLLGLQRIKKEDYELYELIISNKIISKLFGRLIWYQLSRDQNSEGQMNRNGERTLKVQIGYLTSKIVYMLMESMGYNVHMKGK